VSIIRMIKHRNAIFRIPGADSSKRLIITEDCSRDVSVSSRIFSWEARLDQLISSVAEIHACIRGSETQSLSKSCFLEKGYSIKYNSIGLRCCVGAGTKMKIFTRVSSSSPQKSIPFQSGSILPFPNANKPAPEISPCYLYTCSFVW
jgi:hypothetical protein